MSHLLTQARTIERINSQLIKKEDLTSEYNLLSTQWNTTNKEILMATKFAEYWVIVKDTKSGSANYNMYCGRNVEWRNTQYVPPARKPDIILVFENNDFKGILIGCVINELITMGMMSIFSWITKPSAYQTSNPIAYINAGGMLIPVEAGTSIQLVHHGVPNLFPSMMNISDFRRIRF